MFKKKKETDEHTKRIDRLIVLERENALLHEKIKFMEHREKQLNEIVYDLEENMFSVSADEYSTLITADAPRNSSISNAIEIDVISSENEIEGGVFAGKKIKFKIKHPRTFR